MLEKYYNANLENELVGSSVPATEHSVASTNILNTAAKIDSVEEEFNEETGEWVIKKILFNNDSFCLL
jgi:nicotinamide phosphoribosyltransferase